MGEPHAAHRLETRFMRAFWSEILIWGSETHPAHRLISSRASTEPPLETRYLRAFLSETLIRGSETQPTPRLISSRASTEARWKTRYMRAFRSEIRIWGEPNASSTQSNFQSGKHGAPAGNTLPACISELNLSMATPRLCCDRCNLPRGSSAASMVTYCPL